MKQTIFSQSLDRFTLIAFTFLLSLAGVYAAPKPNENLKPTVILVSLDGFRYDYLDKYSTPNLNELARTGVRAKWMIPVYPALTFPNHYSIATGLYSENHGIVGNNIYDPVFKAFFSLGKREEVENNRWWQGEPIWVTAEKQGQKAGTFFFPGTETEIAGKRPTYWKPYDKNVPYGARVDQILAWLDLPRSKRPTFFSLYFEEPDGAGHAFGPDSPEAGKAVAEVDAQVGRLIDGLKTRKVYDKVNLIIVSDHGMAGVDPSQVDFLDDIFDLNHVEQISWAAELVNIFPKPGEESNLLAAVRNNHSQHIRCFPKSEVPSRFHYQNNRRIGAIVCMAEEGWRITTHSYYAEQTVRQTTPLPRITGSHGYDNQLESMRAVFIAHGAAFKRGYVAEPFENVQVYNIMTSILGLKPAKNDGRLELVRSMLKGK